MEYSGGLSVTTRVLISARGMQESQRGDVPMEAEVRVKWGHEVRNVAISLLEKQRNGFSPRVSRLSTGLPDHFKLLITKTVK